MEQQQQQLLLPPQGHPAQVLRKTASLVSGLRTHVGTQELQE
jgi:hypothetical protein